MRAFIPIACLLVVAVPASAQVYKWVDPSGRVTYGDSPPEDSKRQELRITIPSYEGPVEVRDWVAVLKRKPPPEDAPRSVTMYSTSWCGHCKNARAYFASKGIRYADIDVEKSEAGRDEYKKLGGGGVPLIVVGSKLMRGFSAKRFEEISKKS